MKPVTPSQMRKLDEKAIKQYGIPSIVLMENAGRGAAERIFKGLSPKGTVPKVLIICGTGNNGGDGFVVARYLANKRIKVESLLLGSPKKLTPDALINYKIIKKMKIPVRDYLRRGLSLKADLIVDAIFGTGLSRPIEGRVADVIQTMSESKKPIIALDIPSGLNGATGEVMGVAVKAKETMTFAAPKVGFYKKHGPKLTGNISVVDISIPRILYKQ